MKREGDPRDWRLVILLVRALKGWTDQVDMAKACRINQDLISEYERGLKVPSSATRQRIAAGMGVEVSFLEHLVPLCRGVRLAFERAFRQARTGSTAAVDQQRLEETVTGAVLDALAPFLLQLTQLGGEPRPRAEDRAWAEELWKVMEPLEAEDQRLIANTLQNERSWALAERICEASAAAAADHADEALRLAELAVAIARDTPEGPWRLLLLGWCEPFLASSLRGGGNLAAAKEAFARADEHWEQGAGGDPARLLDGTRRLDHKASLLRQQGKRAARSS